MVRLEPLSRYDESKAMTEQAETKTIGIRDVLGGVNLRDFFDMVKGEVGMVWTAARAAVTRHPLLIPPALLLVLLRLLLLAGVIVVLGGAITLVMAVRGVSKTLGGAREKPA